MNTIYLNQSYVWITCIYDSNLHRMGLVKESMNSSSQGRFRIQETVSSFENPRILQSHDQNIELNSPSRVTRRLQHEGPRMSHSKLGLYLILLLLAISIPIGSMIAGTHYNYKDKR